MQGPFKALQQIAFGHVVLPSGKTRRMYNYEIINLAREAFDQLGIAYSNGACDPFKPTAKAADKFAGARTGALSLNGRMQARYGDGLHVPHALSVRQGKPARRDRRAG
jgi:hypothetical protein